MLVNRRAYQFLPGHRFAAPQSPTPGRTSRRSQLLFELSDLLNVRRASQHLTRGRAFERADPILVPSALDVSLAGHPKLLEQRGHIEIVTRGLYLTVGDFADLTSA